MFRLGKWLGETTGELPKSIRTWDIGIDEHTRDVWIRDYDSGEWIKIGPVTYIKFGPAVRLQGISFVSKVFTNTPFDGILIQFAGTVTADLSKINPKLKQGTLIIERRLL